MVHVYGWSGTPVLLQAWYVSQVKWCEIKCIQMEHSDTAQVSVLFITPEGIFFVKIHTLEESATGKQTTRQPMCLCTVSIRDYFPGAVYKTIVERRLLTGCNRVNLGC